MSKIGRGNPFPIDVPTISLVATTVSVNEGQTLLVSVSRTGNTSYTSTCKLFTIAGSANEADYAAQNGVQVTFNPTETSKTVSIAISNDALLEGDEDFLVQIANPNLAILGNNKCVVTITGQGIPSVTVTGVSNASAEEGLALVHTVSLSSSGGGMFTYAITNGTTSSGDYTLPPTFNNGVTLLDGIITVPNGVNSFTATIQSTEDATVEANETYTITVGGVSGTGTILNDDAPAAASISSVSSPTVTEGGTLVFNVALTAPSIGQSFAYSLSGTAGGGTDYGLPLTFNNGVTISGGNIIVPNGVSSFTASTITSDDVVIESTETVVLTISGVSGIGSIIDNDSVTLAPLTKIVPFELPYGMLNSAQKTAAATSGGYAGFAASRDTLDAALYAIYSSTAIDGTYTKIADDVLFTPSALLTGAINPDHRTISVIDEKDFPTSISETTVGLIADTAGQREHVLLNAYTGYTIGGDTSKVLENIGVGCFDTPPIQVHQDDTARVFVLTNYGLDPTLIANGVTKYYKLAPKDSAGNELALSEITPVSLTITSRASKPYPPRKVEFKAEEDADYETYPGRDLPFDDLLMRISTASKTGETTPSSFFNPSGLNEATVTYHVDVYGVDGVVVRTIDFSGGLATYGAFDHGEDIQQAITEYRFYAKKGAVKSAEVIVKVQQQVRGTYPEVSSVVVTQSGTNILATVTFDRTRAYYFGVDYLLTGTAITEATLGAISVGTGATLIENNRIKVSPSTASIVITIAKGTATGKDITVSVGNDNSMQDDTHTIT